MTIHHNFVIHAFPPCWPVLHLVNQRLLCLTCKPFGNSVDQNQTAQNVQSDPDLHCPIQRYLSPKTKPEKASFKFFTHWLKDLLPLF